MGTKHGIAHRLYTGELSFDFVARRKRWYKISAVLMAVFMVSLLLQGLNLSIDFKGGTEFVVPTQVTSTSVDDYRKVVQDLNLPDTTDVQTKAVGDREVRIQLRSLSPDEITTVRDALAAKAGLETTQVANSLIGPTWGKQITKQGLTALVVFLALVSVMIAVYFRNWKMSVAAIVALLHDLMVTVGMYSLLQFTFSPSSLIGMLTILGYSLYDTVVVFDRVRENTADLSTKDVTYGAASNLAVNQVLMRSINTTIIGVLPVAALLFAGVFILGTGPLVDLGLALFVGMIAGAYSSIFIATPLLVDMKNREPEIRQHSENLERKKARRKARAKRTEAAEAESETSEPTSHMVAVAADTEPVDPAELGAVSVDELIERRQPKRTSRSERKK